MIVPGASLSSSSGCLICDGGVGTLLDPCRVVHKLPNYGLDGSGDFLFLQRGMFNFALSHSAAGALLSTPSPTHATSCDPSLLVDSSLISMCAPYGVGIVGNFMHPTFCVRASSVQSCVGPCPDTSVPEGGSGPRQLCTQSENGGATLVAPGRVVQNLPKGNFMQPKLPAPRPRTGGALHILDSSSTIPLTCYILRSDYAAMLPDSCDTLVEGGDDTFVAPGRVVQNQPKNSSLPSE